MLSLTCALLALTLPNVKGSYQQYPPTSYHQPISRAYGYNQNPVKCYDAKKVKTVNLYGQEPTWIDCEDQFNPYFIFSLAGFLYHVPELSKFTEPHESVSMVYDCDDDALWIRVQETGTDWKMIDIPFLTSLKVKVTSGYEHTETELLCKSASRSSSDTLDLSDEGFMTPMNSTGAAEEINFQLNPLISKALGGSNKVTEIVYKCVLVEGSGNADLENSCGSIHFWALVFRSNPFFIDSRAGKETFSIGKCPKAYPAPYPYQQPPRQYPSRYSDQQYSHQYPAHGSYQEYTYPSRSRQEGTYNH